MLKNPSFQDLLATSSEEIVGREAERKLFEPVLTDPEPPFLIMAIYGQGGVGKTTLLTHFRRLAERQRVATALANEDHSSVPEVLAQLAHDLQKSGLSFVDFSRHYNRYCALREKVGSDPAAPASLLAPSLRVIAKVGMRSVDQLPFGKEVKEVLLGSDDKGDELSEKVTESISEIGAYLLKKFKAQEDRKMIQNPERELTIRFIRDLNKHTSRSLLFFDAYEKTSDILDGWLRNFIAGTYGEFNAGPIFLIAGRDPLGQSWAVWRKAILQRELGPFTEAEARKYLDRENVTDDDRIEQLMKLSQRLPLLLEALASSSSGAGSTEIVETAIECFLEGVPRQQKERSLLASVPRFFNHDVLRVIIDDDSVEDAFESLVASTFVNSRAKGWVYHEVIRTLMVRYFRLRSETDFRLTHDKLANYYFSLIEKRRDPTGPWKGKAQARNEVEWLYHHLSRLQASAIEPELINLCQKLNSEDEQILRTYAATLAQVSDEADDLSLERWEEVLEQAAVPLVMASLC